MHRLVCSILTQWARSSIVKPVYIICLITINYYFKLITVYQWYVNLMRLDSVFHWKCPWEPPLFFWTTKLLLISNWKQRPASYIIEQETCIFFLTNLSTFPLCNNMGCLLASNITTKRQKQNKETFYHGMLMNFLSFMTRYSITHYHTSTRNSQLYYSDVTVWAILYLETKWTPPRPSL